MDMSKKIGMFVWNHFTNDARVLRECTALAEKGYDVRLIAIHNPNQKGLKNKENRDGFNIVRVSRYPKYILLLNKIINKVFGVNLYYSKDKNSYYYKYFVN